MEKENDDEQNFNIPHMLKYQLIARQEATQVIYQHLRLCPFAAQQIEQRLRICETRNAWLFGFMLGSGLIGGGVGAALANLLAR
jgi:hypothetical protein